MRVSGFERAVDLRRPVGRISLVVAGHAGRFSFMLVDMVRGLADWRTYLPLTIDQASTIGYGSMFIVLLIAAFAGGVTSLQTGYQFTGAYPLYIAGGIINESVILELGPVLTGLILAGRIGARFAAELGTMRVTEQIDALESLGRSPVTHLLLPRCLAGIFVIPTLVMFANAIGIFAGYIAAKSALGITNADFVYGARYFFHNFDMWYSAIKAFFFAVAVTTIPCYIGFNTQQGAEGVGRATTQAVVSASVTILLLDLVLAQVLLGGRPR
jgi:phospholipid/cholesterol/gamma-HCH transport system permease protein